MVIYFHSDGRSTEGERGGSNILLPAGDYLFDTRSTVLKMYNTGAGLNGFWSTIGSGFSKIGSWVNNHFGEIAIAGASIYALHQGAQLGSGLTQQQAAANAAAQQQTQAQPINEGLGGMDLAGLLPIAVVGVLAYAVLKN